MEEADEAEVELFLADEAEVELFWADEADAELFLADEAEAELFWADETDAELFLADEAEAGLFWADEADGVFLEELDLVDLLLSGCITSRHLVLSKFKVYPVTHSSHLLSSGHFKQLSIEVHFLFPKIIPILIDNININNLLYLFKENNIFIFIYFNDINFNKNIFFY